MAMGTEKAFTFKILKNNAGNIKQFKIDNLAVENKAYKKVSYNSDWQDTN